MALAFILIVIPIVTVIYIFSKIIEFIIPFAIVIFVLFIAYNIDKKEKLKNENVKNTENEIPPSQMGLFGEGENKGQ